MPKTSALRMFVARALPAAAILWCASPALAASATTEVFLANVRLHLDVLTVSSRAAAKKAQSDALKRFAVDETTHQDRVLAGLDAWWAHGDDATQAKVASLPLETGRSVAIDTPANAQSFAPPPGIGVLMTGASASLDHLSSLDGPTFDTSYKATQIATLQTLEGLYDAYAQTGDNPALRDLATREAAEARAEIATLNQI